MKNGLDSSYFLTHIYKSTIFYSWYKLLLYLMYRNLMWQMYRYFLVLFFRNQVFNFHFSPKHCFHLAKFVITFIDTKWRYMKVMVRFQKLQWEETDCGAKVFLFITHLPRNACKALLSIVISVGGLLWHSDPQLMIMSLTCTWQAINGRWWILVFGDFLT